MPFCLFIHRDIAFKNATYSYMKFIQYKAIYQVQDFVTMPYLYHIPAFIEDGNTLLNLHKFV